MERPAAFDAADRRVAFRLYPQPPFVPGYEKPERVLCRVQDYIASGPSDARMYVADAFDKPWPYAFPYLPPFESGQSAPVHPDALQGFALYEPGTQHFLATHLFGSVTWLLEIWERYRGRRIPWHFDGQRLELIPFVDWENAQAGYGFLETGYGQAPDGRLWPFALSFDVIAHEVGHLLLYSLLGLPQEAEPAPAFGAFHEAASDIMALVGLLHFESALERILRRSAGNLYLDNELNRFGELSSSGEIRNVINALTLDDVADENNLHRRSLVLSGAFYDILVEAYAIDLVAEGVLDREDLAALRGDDLLGRRGALVARKIAADGLASGACARALRRARDFLGLRLLHMLPRLDPDAFSLRQVAGAFLAADLELTGERRNQAWIAACFRWRGILPPRAAPVLRLETRRRHYLHRRLAAFPEPYEFHHRCAVHGRRVTTAPAIHRHPLQQEVSHVFE